VKLAGLMALLFVFPAPEGRAKTLQFCQAARDLGSKKLRCSAKVIDGLARLPRFKALRQLDFTRSGLRDLRPIAALTKLTVLGINYTAIKSLGPLKSLRDLVELDASNTGIGDLLGVEGLKRLRNLTLWNTKLDDLGPLASLSGLESLVLGGSRVASLGVLAKLPRLRSLNLEGTPISSVTALHGLKELRYVTLGRTSLKAADLAGLRKARPKLVIYGCDHPGDTPCRAPKLEMPTTCVALLTCCTELEKAKAWRARCGGIRRTLDELASGGSKALKQLQQVCQHNVRALGSSLPKKRPPGCTF
jgi:hypothetical protein